MQSNSNSGRFNPFTQMLTEAFDFFTRSLMVCLPGYVLTFDPNTQLAQVQCGIKKVDTGTNEGVTIPPIDNVPIHFPGDNNFYMWHKIEPGCEGFIVFSQRAIDEWVNTGELKAPHDLRTFSEKDAMFIPGMRTQPNSIPDFKNEGIGFSDYAGENFMHLKDGVIEITTTTLRVNANIEHIGDTDQTGDLNRTGDTETTGEMNNNGKAVGSTLKVTGVTPGGGISGVPQ